jgi:hypothetical protein
MASFKNFNRVSGYKDILKQKSLIRINESPLFESIKVRKQWQEDNEIEFLDLNFKSRKKQKNKIEAFLLSNQNSLREKVNLPTYETYKEFMEREDDPDILDIDSEILGEAANILIDLIELKNKPLLALSTKQDNDESYLIQYQ